ncbi:hypothetical protein [Halobacterium bonnevillei]|uniref:Uncharacterized protein n=1 Tax=Halobacterium bonnevillei TaxID=2692200 RepID=A0A6B0SEG7_9EURY|nr:hypothetical protein [Halobacterium bonnevillei]MXR19106.1 hypothetical protein [Halobacterium bonnevillei]
MTDNQAGPNHRSLSAAYRQAGYTITDAPGFQRADAATLWVARDDQPIAVVASLRNPTKPGVLLRNVDQLSRHARIHLVTGSPGIASRVRELLRNPVRRRTDCGVECFLHPAQFVLDGSRLAVSEPHVWIATTDEQSPPDGTVLSATLRLANASESETEPSNPAARSIKKRPGYESTVTELESTETLPESSYLVRKPVITDQPGDGHGVVVAVLSDSGLTADNPARNRAPESLGQETKPPRVLGDEPWAMSAPPALAVTRLHLVAQREWEDR